jgi:hypothetical protein
MPSSENHPIKKTNWLATRTVWSTVGTDLPEISNERYNSYSDDLQQARHSYLAMKESLKAARAVSVDLKKLADHCRDLCDDLTGIDPLSSSRLAGATRQSLNNLLTDAVSTLAQLEMGLRTAKVPSLPRKKPNEHLNFLVERLADIYEKRLGKTPSVYTDRETDERVGDIIGFVEAFNDCFLDGEIDGVNARAIQRALQARTKAPPP